MEQCSKHKHIWIHANTNLHTYTLLCIICNQAQRVLIGQSDWRIAHHCDGVLEQNIQWDNRKQKEVCEQSCFIVNINVGACKPMGSRFLLTFLLQPHAQMQINIHLHLFPQTLAAQMQIRSGRFSALMSESGGRIASLLCKKMHRILWFKKKTLHK